VGQELLTIEAARSHSHTPNSVGILWTNDQPEAETYAWKHTILTRDRHSCSRRDSTPPPQHTSGLRPTPYTARPLGSTPKNLKAFHFS